MKNSPKDQASAPFPNQKIERTHNWVTTLNFWPLARGIIPAGPAGSVNKAQLDQPHHFRAGRKTGKPFFSGSCPDIDALRGDSIFAEGRKVKGYFNVGG